MYDKGTAARNFLNDDNYDFVIAVGDDRTDEDLFKAMPVEAITIKIGNEPTVAKYNLKKQSHLYDFVQATMQYAKTLNHLY